MIYCDGLFVNSEGFISSKGSTTAAVLLSSENSTALTCLGYL